VSSLDEKLEGLPAQPGVYLFKDKTGTVVYVGKAKSLKSRVRSYFQASSSDDRAMLPFLLEVIVDAETIVTGSEKEAAILENTLIKQHQPRYNIKLRDDKEFLSIRLSLDHPWPRLDVVRRPQRDGARYFGPYHSASAARRSLHLINKHFQLRTCTDGELERRRRPCLQHQIKRCPAPCVLPVEPSWYREQVDAVEKFLDGRHDELSGELTNRMAEASRGMAFELAAVYRDQLRALEKVREDQRIVFEDPIDRDVVGYFRDGEAVEIALLYLRAGRIADVSTRSLKAVIPDAEVIAAFVSQHYGAQEEGEAVNPIPREILLPLAPEASAGVAEWLSEQAGHRVAITVPKRGAKVKLLRLATDNARHAFHEKRRVSDDAQERLAVMQEVLRLDTLPMRIECCDISHLGGGDTSGAVVAMRNGEFDKKRYRSFHVRGGEAGAFGDAQINDDYASMYEVLSRRFHRGLAERDTDDKAWELPDLFVVDGGRGQLGAALAAAHDLGLHDLAIVSLAKERETATGKLLVDRVYLPGQKNPIAVHAHAAALSFLPRLRDEAHRFSNTIREKLGTRRRLRSQLDDVKGLGRETKKRLLRHFGDVGRVFRATDDELLAVKGVLPRHVAALRAHAAAAHALPGPRIAI
jgi:excinuclease ABC subunit C